jgi:uncharacterized protein YihD (DUF1040 family)
MATDRDRKNWRNYYSKNADRIKANQKAYYKKHKDKVLARVRKYQEQHIEENRARANARNAAIRKVLKNHEDEFKTAVKKEMKAL